MIAQCCRITSTIRPSGAAASLLPGAALLLLPKCPLCLAAWLGLAGIGVSAAAAAWMRCLIVLIWVVAVALVAARIIRGRAGS
jgi:hypothetical protein